MRLRERELLVENGQYRFLRQSSVCQSTVKKISEERSHSNTVFVLKTGVIENREYIFCVTNILELCGILFSDS